jgi:phage terminase large subunit
MEAEKSSFDQLELRTTKLGILDYNPSNDTHWVFDLKKRDDVAFIQSTRVDNPFIGEAAKRKILSFEPTIENIRQGTADEYMWQVYGLGNPAKLKGAIFEKWDIVDTIPVNAKDMGIGLDFGYTNDPTAIIALYMYNNELYLDELVYEKGLVNYSVNPADKSIVKFLNNLNLKYTPITPDSAEPKSIAEIASHGFFIENVDKGKDSVVYGINLLKGYKIHITRRSINLEKELRNYKWREDKAGSITNVPIDEFNHAIDAVRYRAMRVLANTNNIQIFKKNYFS